MWVRAPIQLMIYKILTQFGGEDDLDEVTAVRQRLQLPQAVMAAVMLRTTASRGLTPSFVMRSEQRASM
jgi:hypothetical protein